MCSRCIVVPKKVISGKLLIFFRCQHFSFSFFLLHFPSFLVRPLFSFLAGGQPRPLSISCNNTRLKTSTRLSVNFEPTAARGVKDPLRGCDDYSAILTFVYATLKKDRRKNNNPRLCFFLLLKRRRRTTTTTTTKGEEPMTLLFNH